MRILQDITHILARAGAHEVLAGKILATHAHLDPLARLLKERFGLGDLVVGHAVGKVAAVALMPALPKAVIAQAAEALDKRQIFHCHCLSPLRDPQVQLKNVKSRLTAARSMVSCRASAPYVIGESHSCPAGVTCRTRGWG